MSVDGKCWICGADIVKSYPATDIMSGRFCHEHWLQHTREYKKTVSAYLKLKTQVMFERAMRIMEKCLVNMTEYKKEAEAVKKHSEECPECYKSSHEMVAAVVLLHAGCNWLNMMLNHKVGRFIVDIYLPDLDIIVEIDGDRHEHRLLYDSKRDSEIRNKLNREKPGAEWEIIRIPIQFIEQNPERLPEAIRNLADHKRSIRKKNGGFLPQNYSKREAALYENAMIFDEIHVPT